MGKVLKVLTIIVFLLSIVAFILGMMNFNKRELLIARTRVLEESLIKIASTFEAADPVFEGDADHDEYDVDDVTDMPNDAPTTSEFWESYDDSLEVMDVSTLNLNTEDARFTLRQYYFLADPENPSVPNYETGVPVKDSLGEFKTSGSGTMQELLDLVQERANGQRHLLLKTREQLISVREELEKVINLYNEEKKSHRQSKATITSLNQKIAELEEKISTLERQISQLEREKVELTDKISALEAELALKAEENTSLASEISSLKEEIKRLTETDPVGAVAAPGGSGPISTVVLSPGNKGKIVGVDNSCDLVVVQLTDAAMKEILGEDMSKEFVPIEMMVIREGLDGPAGPIVTRIRIDRVSLDGSNLGYADNLYGWEQSPVQVGDSVIY